MRKVIFKKTHSGHQEGETAMVGNMEAHDLIEAGVAKLYTGVAPKKEYKTRVMRPRKRSYGYHVK